MSCSVWLWNSLPAATKMWPRLCFLQVCVCPQGGRVSASVHAGMPDQADTPQTRQTPPQPGRPPVNRQTPPKTRQTPPQTRQTPLGPGRPPRTRQTPPGEQTPAYGLRAAGTHPTGMHSCLKNVCAMQLFHFDIHQNLTPVRITHTVTTFTIGLGLGIVNNDLAFHHLIVNGWHKI